MNIKLLKYILYPLNLLLLFTNYEFVRADESLFNDVIIETKQDKCNLLSNGAICDNKGNVYNTKIELAPLKPPQPSIDFIAGRWQVKQIRGGSIITYKEDGKFTGQHTSSSNGIVQNQIVQGRWNFEKISNNMFRMILLFDNKSRWVGTFKIIDQNQINNIDENYTAVRI